MSDIVEELRADLPFGCKEGMAEAAADEIERLRRELNRTRDALDFHVENGNAEIDRLNGQVDAQATMIAECEDGRCRLLAFVDEAFQVWPYGDWNGGALQDALVRHGFLALKDPPPREPCGPDCLCADSYLDEEFAGGDVQCYRRVRPIR